MTDAIPTSVADFDLDQFPKVWVVDADWDVPDNAGLLGCRMCGKPSAAVLYRPYKGGLPRRWAYCKEHMYGREIIRGLVHIQVCADSLSARRGHAMIQHGKRHG